MIVRVLDTKAQFVHMELRVKYGDMHFYFTIVYGFNTSVECKTL